MKEGPLVTIAGKPVGAGRPVYVIAEAGVNHDGDLGVACALLRAAKDAGADAVKFQVFSADRLVSASAPACSYQKDHDAKAVSQRAMLERLELDTSDFRTLRRAANEAGVDFLATPFGVAELSFLANELAVPAIKIASSDLTNVPLLDAAVESERPLIVSTGASRPEEIDRAVHRVTRLGALRRLVLLHCVSSYPTRIEDARLGCIRTLSQRFGVPVGFSDHTASVETGGMAVLAGAAVVEKHLTLDRSAVGPDHFFSLEPEAFGAFVRGIRRAETIRGDGQLGCGADELEVRKLARGRIVTTRAVTAGETLTAVALSVQRPGDGIDPEQWEDVLGRVASADIPADTPLAWSMLVATDSAHGVSTPRSVHSDGMRPPAARLASHDLKDR